MIDVDAYYEQKIGLLWRTLRGGLWHATPSHRFRTILKTGHILCDPQLVEGEFQWASANGFTTLCRDIGAVSLFDFGEADWPWIFENHHDWLSFLKAPQLAVPEDKWIAIVWIGFDRQSLKNLIRHSPYTIQIRGNRTTFPPPRELYPLCSHPMA